MDIIKSILAFLVCDAIYFIFFKIVDYYEKGNHKKTYNLNAFKFIMVHYSSVIKPWEIERQIKPKNRREKDLLNSTTISKLSFWMQISNWLFALIYIAIEIVYYYILNNNLTYILHRTFRVSLIAVLPFLIFIYFIKDRINARK